VTQLGLDAIGHAPGHAADHVANENNQRYSEAALLKVSGVLRPVRGPHVSKTLLEDAHGNFIDRRRKPGTKIESLKAGRGSRKRLLKLPEAPTTNKASPRPAATFGQRQASLLTTRIAAHKPSKP